MLGLTPNIVLLPLARMIKAASSDFHLSIVGLRDRKNWREIVSQNGYDAFDSCLPSIIREEKISKLTLKASRACQQAIGKPIIISQCRFFLKDFLIRRKLRKRFKVISRESDVLHIHGLFIDPTHRYLAKSLSKPLVVSCWGSDVMRSSDLITIDYQQRLLKQASIITTTGSEFREIILSKYGRDLAPKIHYSHFNPCIDDYVHGDRKMASKGFRSRHDIPDEMTIVCLGHNGHPGGQQIELIRSLEVLDEEYRKKIFVVIPMTYPGDENYRQEVHRRLRCTKIAGVVLKDFLSDAELKEMRLATDILIFAPVSDSFAGSVSQSIAAGSVAILGSWLPYGTRRRAGFKYHEIANPPEAGRALKSILKEWPKPQLQCQSNRMLSEKFFEPKRLGQGWLDAYEKAILNFSEKNPKDSFS